MPRKSPDIKQLAVLGAMTEIGHSPTEAAQICGMSHNTALKYVRQRSDLFHQPDVRQLIDQIKAAELADTRLLASKARVGLHLYLDKVLSGEVDGHPIALTAIADRFFNQTRLLENQSTGNISLRSLAEQLAADRERIMADIAALEAEIAAQE